METLTWTENLLDRASVRIAPWTPGLWPADDVEAVGRLDHLALVGLDADLAAAVHRGVGDRQHRRRDEGRVVDEKDLAFGHGPDQRPVDELEGAVGLLGVLAGQVGGRGVAVAGHRDQVIAEGGLDQRGLPGTGRAVQQGRHSGVAQLAQGLDVGHVRQRPRLVDLAAWAGDRAGRSRLGGRRGYRGRRGGGGGRRGGGGRLGRKGGLGRDGGGCGGGGRVRLVADGLAGHQAASPRSARVVSALPTAPADLSRALAISPVLQGPGWSVRYSATWRRSWPLPSRPLGAAAGAAGAVIGITSVRRGGIGAGIGVRTLFAITRNSNFPGEFPPVFPGTQRRYLAFSGGVNAFPPRIRGISARIPREFVTDSRGRPLPSAAAPFPARRPPFARAFPRPPPAASRGPPAWPYRLAGGLGRGPGPAGAGPRGADVYIHETGTTGK